MCEFYFCSVCQTTFNDRFYTHTYIGYKGGWLSCCSACNRKLKKDDILDENYRLIKYVPLYQIRQINEIESD